MAEVQMTAVINVFAIGQQHTKQPEFNNEGEVDQNAEQCHETRPLSTKLTDNQKTELLNQSLESKNICLKKTVAQFQKDFSKLEAHCINHELQLQNNVLKSGQQSQVLNEKSNKAKVKHDIDVIETINIELEHKVAKLRIENKTLKRHYKELSDSIKTTRAKTIEHTTSLIAQNAEFKAQLQEKGFAITALKNELRKLTRNSVNTKFAKSSILGKPVLQSLRNQSVVRQPTTFKSKRPRISKPWFASQVDVNNDFLKLVTTHYLPRERESAFAKPHHMIAPSSSRWVPTGKTFTSSTTMVDNEPTNGSNDDITNQFECEQTLDVSAGTLNLSAGDKTATSRQELELLFHHQITMLRLYGGGGIPFQLKSDSLPHAHAQTTKTYYKHQDSRIMKAQELNTKTSANSDIKDNSSETKLQGRLLASFQDDAKYKHVGQDTRSQGGKDDQD
ncbi:hypothetical protein Tco_0889734 [Tanacetum coccineum]